MNYTARALDYLEAQVAWRYNPASSPAAEPTAFAAIALAAYGRAAAAARARNWLLAAQNADGSVPVRPGTSPSMPEWPTALAVLAWNQPTSASPVDTTFAETSRRAVAWLLSIAGETSKRQPYTGHDTQLKGWPWVTGTHSWVEPTAMSVLALRAVGLGDHARSREAVQLLTDRLLSHGGANYGNTIVLDQELLPHVEPTGAALLALAGESASDARIDKALDYLAGALDADTAPASLSYGLLGLAAFGRTLPTANAWLAAATTSSVRREASLDVALVALAALGADSPLVQLSPASAAAL